MKVNSFLIDQQGFLSIERAPGQFKLCFCPEASSNMTIRCGDWCPHFSEPVFSGEVFNGQYAGTLNLTCHSGNCAIRGIVIDRRKQGEN